MSDIDENRRRLELLRTARQQLTDEYFLRRAEIHKKWQVDSQSAWINGGTLLPYPPVEALPTEKDVVARALELYKAQAQPQPKAEITQTQTAQTAPALPATDDSMTVSVTAQLEQAYNTKRLGKQPVIPPENLNWEDFLSPAKNNQPVEPEPMPVEEPVNEPVNKPVEEKIVAEELVDAEETEETAAEAEERSNNRLRLLLAKFVKMAKDLDKKDESKQPNKDNDNV